VTGSETHRACDTLTAGPDVTVASGGNLTLRAGTRIVLQDGFHVESGGALALEIF
jgi:adhesin HecA-like repeat protein